MKPEDFKEGALDAEKLVTAIDPDYWQRFGFPHPLFDRLRKEAPIAYVEHPDIEPYWAVSLNKDIREISRNPAVFSNVGTLSLNLRDASGSSGGGEIKPTLLNMDPPGHDLHRGIVGQRFQMAEVIRRDDPFLAAAVREILDEFMGDGGVREQDFVQPAQRLSIAAVGRVLASRKSTGSRPLFLPMRLQPTPTRNICWAKRREIQTRRPTRGCSRYSHPSSKPEQGHLKMISSRFLRTLNLMNSTLSNLSFMRC